MCCNELKKHKNILKATVQAISVWWAFIFALTAIMVSCSKDDKSSSEEVFLDLRDSTVYQIIEIGSQVWMAENLNYRTASGSWYYNNDSAAYASEYGRLYNWGTALEAVPDGWHLPSDEEWTVLIDYLGGATLAGGKLKEVGISHWTEPNTGATNKSNFTARPGGYRDTNGFYSQAGVYGNWWSATETSTGNARSRGMYYNSANVGRINSAKTYGVSVRCIRD